MAILDLTTFTEVDPNTNWVQTTTRNTGTTVRRNDNSYVYKDYGVDYFKSYEIWLDVRLDSVSDDGAFVGIFKVDNNIASGVISGQNIYFSRIGSSARINVRSSGTIDFYSGSLDTVYYLKVYREDDRIYVKIYSTSSDRIADTNVLDALDPGVLGADNTAWRYLYCGVGFNSGAPADFATVWIENVNLQFADMPDVNELENLTLTDNTYLKLMVEINETLGLADNMLINLRELFLDESLLLSDIIETNVSLEKENPEITLSLTDEVIAGYEEIEDINNDFNSVLEIYTDVDNKINVVQLDQIDINNKSNTVKGELLDIIQKINTAKLELKDMRMAFHSAFGTIDNVDNKINTLIRSNNNIKNDFRMRLPWQVAGNLGVQSLGKQYIKIYINSIEITDVDIDSIKITKSTGTAFTATFALERAYDVNHPTLELPVLIKYNDIILYRGYLVSISPTDNPEKIQLNCQNKYWKNNKNKVWFNIGHRPSDNTELYYNKISEGLSAIGLNFGIGDFIPQTMNLFGTGNSDAISALVQNCGNFDWYYDDNEIAKLWTANGGSIINIEPQRLGENLDLYQILSHNITKSAENVVNKLRVQMGDQVIRHPGRQGENRTYTSKIISTSRIRAIPMWASSLENFAPQGGYGFNYHLSDTSYANVFKKYKFSSYLGNNSEWTDWRPPVVEVTKPFGGSISVPSSKDGILTEGYSINFKEGILTLSDPLYYYTKSANGETDKLFAPVITIIIYKQTYITHTETTSDSPEINISNPLMFFTNKVGTYPTTNLSTLNLTGLSIQGGILSINVGDIRNHTPSWDDRPYAKDLAYWNLSETADKKISGTIKITLDSAIFYGVELNKRIMVQGILSEPLNIKNISYNMNDFTVDLQVENFRYYKRTVNMASHGQGMSSFSTSSSNFPT